jgi:hypothetical protein
MAKITLNEWINSKQKAKGLSTKQAKASASKYKSISAAKKAGSLYYTNKAGKIMIAATAEDLKVTKPKPRPKIKPKKRPDTVTLVGGMYGQMTVAEKREVDEKNAAIKAAAAARKNTGPNAARKKRMKVQLRGAEWMAANTPAAYAALTKSEASALGLPRTRVAAMQSTLRKNKFKDGQGWDYSIPRKK